MKQSKTVAISPETEDSPNRYLDALRLIKNITVAANASATVEQAVSNAMEHLLAFTNWYAGAIFLPAEGDSFRLAHICSRDVDDDVSALQIELADARWRPGQNSIVGRVVQTTEPEWVTERDVMRNPRRYLYGAITLKHGYKTTLAFPVVADGKVSAVFVLGDTATLPHDPLLSELMKEIGVQLGHVARREEARRALEAKQTALTEVLDNIQDRQDDVGRRVVANVERLVMPQIRQLKHSLRGEYISSIRQIESALHEITSPFADNLSRRMESLTPAEIRISRHIRHGLSVKEIARIEGISSETVSTHRRSIRRKLGLVKKKTNLAAHLDAMAK